MPQPKKSPAFADLNAEETSRLNQTIDRTIADFLEELAALKNDPRHSSMTEAQLLQIAQERVRKRSQLH